MLQIQSCVQSDSVINRGYITLLITQVENPLAWVVDFFGLQKPDSPEASYRITRNYCLALRASITCFALARLTCRDQKYPENFEPHPVERFPGDDQPMFIAGYGNDDDSSDNDEEEEASNEEDEEHLAPTDSVVAPVPMPFPSEEEVKRLLALPPPPPSPLISLSPPSTEERLARCLDAPVLPSSPLPIVPHLYGSPNHVRAPLGFKATMGRLRASSPSTYHLLHSSPPLPPSPSSLHLPPHVPTSLPL
ncbi:hypothetical protein Tco_0067354 [Tanacetum coccineum]